MKNLLTAIALFAGILGSSFALACSAPENKPEIPDPNTAVTAQMIAANNQVKEYVRATEEYLACARMNTAQLRREEAALREFAEEFNQAVRTFRLASN